MFPARHGLLGHRMALPLDLRTLAELLRDAGFDTAGFITNPGAGSAFGLDRGFTTFELAAGGARNGKRPCPFRPSERKHLRMAAGPGE